MCTTGGRGLSASVLLLTIRGGWRPDVSLRPGSLLVGAGAGSTNASLTGGGCAS